MERLWQDIRYCFRTMLKSKGFTAVAILSLALGIGANTSIFSAVNAVMLRPLPFKDPDRLVQVQRTNPQSGELTSLWSYPKYVALRDGNEAFEQTAAVSLQSFPLTDTDNPERLQVEMVSASYFSILGIEAAAGRAFSPEEDQAPGAHAVAVISYGLWQRRFASDPGLIGETISLNRVPLTVVGVMPEGFRGQSGTVEVWVPMMMAPRLTFPRRLTSAGAHWHEVIARLKPGVTEAQARAEMEVLNARVQGANPGQGEPEAIRIEQLRQTKIDPAIKKSLLILLGAVGFVLLIACVNIANLLLAKAAARRKEIAVRLALGATRARLVRQLLTESVVLALLGGVGGLLLALWGIELLTALNPMSDPVSKAKYSLMLEFNTFSIDGRVLAFTALLSLVTGLLFGLMPALQATRADLNETLKEGGAVPGKLAGRGSHSIVRSAMIVGEVALSLVLLIGAGLMIRSFARLQVAEIGFDPENVLTVRINLPREYGGEKAIAFYDQLLGSTTRLPGVQSASVAISTPLSTNSSMALMLVEGRSPTSEGAGGAVGYHIIGPDHFETLRTPLLRGRAFTGEDRAGRAKVVIISDAAARKFWPGEDPLGKRIWLSVGWKQNEFAEIVGIAGDVKYRNVERVAEPDVYIPYQQSDEPPTFVIARTSNNPGSLVAALRREVQAIDKNLPLYDVKTMSERSRDATSRARFSALLLAIFASLALLLSSIGIFGIMSYSVIGRTREIGIRVALGAQRSDVLGLVLRDALVLTAAGLGLGLAASLAATRVLSSQLYGVGATDPATFAVVSLLLAGVALAASYIPARRATKVDPMIALRQQ